MDVRAKKGNDVKLDCSVTLSTYVRYTWKKWGKPLPVNNRFFSMSNGMLVIKRVGPYDQGVYTCAVSTNSLIVSRRITVLVEGKKHIIILVNNASLMSNMKQNFFVSY